jgi:hypothetical protein
MSTPYTTTKAAMQAMRPCADRWRVFVAAFPALSDDAPVTLESIIDSNGESDVRWVLARMGLPGEIALRAYGSWCALQVLPIYEKAYPNDRRPRNAVEAAQRLCRELSDAARAAARAARAASAAASDAAWDATWAAQLIALRHICRGAFGELDRLGNHGRAK